MSSKKVKKKSSKKVVMPDGKLFRQGWIAIFGLACLLYANTLGNGYTQDDAIVITQNMLTKQGVQGIPGLVTKDSFFGFFKTEGKSKLVAGGRYRPLTAVMFAIEYEIFGEQAWIGHLINMLLYGLTGVLIYFFLFRVLNHTHFRDKAFEIALVTSILFIAHPLHTEVVANIKGRDEIMSLLLALAATFVLIKAKDKLHVQHYLLSGTLFFLALTSKENAITFLAVIPLILYYFTNSKVQQVVIKMLPFVIATVLFLILRGEIIGWDLGDPPRELLNNPFIKIEGNRYVDFTFGEKSATIMFTLGKYIQLLFFPHPLTHDYYPRHIDIMHWSDWRVLLSAAVYCGLLVVAFLGLKKRTLVSFGIFFYLITLSIVSNIVFPVGTNMSERFAYMPSLGWAIAMAGIAVSVHASKRKYVVAALAVVVFAFSIKTIWRNLAWESNYTLFTTDVETSSNSAKLLAAAGGELITTGSKLPEGAVRDKQMREGLDYELRAQRIHPNYKMSYLLRGNAHYYLKEWDQAIITYSRVLDMDPDNTEATRNLGITYRDAGKYYGQDVGDLPKSIEYLKQAVVLLPTDYEAAQGLGVAYGISGQSGQAVQMFIRAVELAPENPTAHFNLGLAYQRIGDEENATIQRNIAIKLDPEILKRRSGRE